MNLLENIMPCLKEPHYHATIFFTLQIIRLVARIPYLRTILVNHSFYVFPEIERLQGPVLRGHQSLRHHGQGLPQPERDQRRHPGERQGRQPELHQRPGRQGHVQLRETGVGAGKVLLHHGVRSGDHRGRGLRQEAGSAQGQQEEEGKEVNKE